MSPCPESSSGHFRVRGRLDSGNLKKPLKIKWKQIFPLFL